MRLLWVAARGEGMLVPEADAPLKRMLAGVDAPLKQVLAGGEVLEAAWVLRGECWFSIFGAEG